MSFEEIIKGLIPNFIAPALILIGGRLVNLYTRKGVTGAARFWLFAKPVILALTIILGCVASIFSEDPWHTRWIYFISITSIYSIFAIWKSIYDLANAGIAGVDPQLNKGTDYKKSLELCQNGLFFLGVGASKLSKHQEELEAAIRRSSTGNQPVRFLLCDPTSIQLSAFASRRGVSPDTYQNSVKESIEKLKQLRDEAHLNIEIRIYTAGNEVQMPLFRLFFMNDDTCLMCHTVFGEGIESELPQYWVKKRRGEKHKHSLYYAMNMYFDQLWSTSTRV
jgi:hypothetical protein